MPHFGFFFCGNKKKKINEVQPRSPPFPKRCAPFRAVPTRDSPHPGPDFGRSVPCVRPTGYIFNAMYLNKGI